MCQSLVKVSCMFRELLFSNVYLGCMRRSYRYCVGRVFSCWDAVRRLSPLRRNPMDPTLDTCPNGMVILFFLQYLVETTDDFLHVISGLSTTWVYPNPQRVSSQDRPINLASAVRVSIDTAVQSCEVRKSVGMVTRAQRVDERGSPSLLNGCIAWLQSQRVVVVVGSCRR
jgi:hypothetical protein